MTLKERVQDIFDKFQVGLEVEEPQSLASAQLESGQEIQTDGDAFSAGASVFVTNDEGERIPLPDGDYTLNDGVKFKVKDGVIAEEEEQEPEAEATAEPKEEEMSAATAKQEIQDALRPLVESMISEAMAPVLEQLKAAEAKVEELNAQPATEPIARVKVAQPVVPVDLSQLNTKDRVKAIQNQYLS